MDQRGRPEPPDEPEARELLETAGLWYPPPAGEAPEQRAARRERYAQAVEATRFNLPPVGGSAALAQLIPSCRGRCGSGR